LSTRRLYPVLALGALLASATSPAGQVSTARATWPVFRADPRGTGTIPTRGVPALRGIKWEFSTGSKITGSAVVGTEAVYFGDWSGTVYALGRDDGRLRWKASVPPLIVSTPVLVGDALYVAGTDAKIHVFESTTGKKLWDLDTREGGRPWMGIRASPVVSDGMLYVGNQQGRFMAIDIDRRVIVWDHMHRNWVMGSAAVAQDTVFVGRMDDYIWAFDRLSGRNKWRLKTGTAVLSSPAYADGILYCGSDDRHLYALDAQTGEEKWRYATAGWVQSAPAVNAGQVYYGSYDGALYANDARTGILNWRFRTGGHVVSSPAVDGQAVYFGSYDGHLYAVHAVQGTELWRFAAAGGVLSSPVVVDGAVYFGSTGGKFYALE
jgi:outer membrane protein assembly factor BamB